jgi:plastocyanin
MSLYEAVGLPTAPRWAVTACRPAEPRFPGRRTRTVKHLSVLAAVAAVLATAAACGGSSAAAPPSPSAGAPVSSAPAAAAASSAPAAPAVVTIKDFAYGVPATVAAGATVQVKNDDGQAHTVTADSGGSFDAMVGANGTASFTAPTKPGRYPFHCTYHGNMHGVLVVA